MFRQVISPWQTLLLALLTTTGLIAGCGASEGELADDEDRGPAIVAPDEKINVSFDSLALPLSEGSFAIIGVILDKPSKTDIKVSLTLSSARFDQAADFEPLQPTITIPKGSLSQAVILRSKDDTVFEGDEEFRLTLYTNTPNTKVRANQLNLTVYDNDPAPTVQFVAASSSSAENSGTTDLPVQLSAAVAVPVTVNYEVTGGTATAGTDFTLASGTLTFAPGLTTQNISLLLLDDTSIESNETAQVTLSAPVNGTLGANVMHTLTIQDNDATPPVIQSLSSTLPNGTYTIGTTVPIVVNFSQPVTVDTSGGTPTLTLETGATDRVATYSSGSGTSALTFTYTIQASDSSADLDYVATSSLVLNGGTIRSAYPLAAVLTLPTPGAANSLGAVKSIAVDTTAPSSFSISGITGGTDTTADGYLSGGTTPTVSWNAATGASGYEVAIRNSADTSDACALQSTGATSYSFTGCTLTEGTSYKVKVSAKDAAGNTTAATNNLFLFTVDTTPPAAFVITGLMGGTDTTANAFLTSGLSAPIVKWNDTTGESGYEVTVLSANGATEICPKTTVAADTTSYTFLGCTLIDGASYTARVTALDSAGNATAATNSSFAFTVDATAPSAPSSVTLIDPASSTGTDQSPTLRVGGVSSGATVSLYKDNTCSTVVTSAAATGATVDLTTPTLSPGSYSFYATSRDAAGNESSCSSASASYAISAPAPTISSVNSSKANGSYKQGESIAISIAFSESVAVDTTGGSPRLLLETGATDRYADYTSGTGSSTLVFTYTVQAGDTSSDLDYTSTSALEVNGSTIRNTSNEDADLTLPAPGVVNSLGANKSIVIDTSAPSTPSALALLSPSNSPGNDTTPTIRVSGVGSGDTVRLFSNNTCSTEVASGSATGTTIDLTPGALSAGTYAFFSNATDAAGNVSSCSSASVAYVLDLTAPVVQSVSSSKSDGAYKAGHTITVTVTFSKNVSVVTSGGTPYLTLETGAADRSAVYSDGSGTATLSFEYTVQAGDTSIDLDYVATTSLALNGGTIKDQAGNNATLTLPSPGAANSLGANKSLVIDTAAPSSFSITGATGGTDSTADGFLTSGTTVTANWNTASGASSYDVVVRNSGDTADQCGVQTTAATSYTFTGCALTNGTGYKIKVTATDAAGNTTVASNDSFSFTVDSNLPGAFNITGVTGGSDSTANAYLTNGQTATVNWNDTTGEASYDVVIRNNADSTDICALATKAADSTSHAFPGCTLTEGTTYKAHVYAKTAGGLSTEASNSPYAFTVDSTAPSAPSGLTLQSPSTSPNTDTTPTVRVSGVASGDTVKLFSDNTCAMVLASEASSGAAVDLTSSVLSAGSFKFYANATDPAGNVSTCSTANVAYVLDLTAPTQPGTLDDGTTSASTTDSPALSWGASTDSSSGLARYEVAIGTAAGATDTKAWTDVGTSTSTTVTGLALTNGTTYYASVRSIDNAGNISAVRQGDGWTVNTGGSGPAAFTITGVTGGTDSSKDDYLTNGTTATVSWNPSADATGYKVKILNNTGSTVVCAEQTTGSTTYTYTFSGCTLTNGTQYRAIVTGTKASGETLASNSPYTFTVQTPKPDNFRITGITGTGDSTADIYLDSSTTVPTINWQAASNASSFEVTVYNSAGTVAQCGPITGISGSATSYAFSSGACTLTNDTEYQVEVLARDSGNSAHYATNANYRFRVTNSAGTVITTCNGVLDNSKNGIANKISTASYSGTIWDSGGSGSNYGKNQICYVEIAPNASRPVVIEAVSFSTQSSDTLELHDTTAATVASPSAAYKIGTYSGTTAGVFPSKVTANSGTMTLLWTSDNAGFSTGYQLKFYVSLNPGGFSISGATGGADSIADGFLEDGTTMTLSWSAATGATGYQIIVRDGEGNHTVCGPINTGSTATSYNLTTTGGCSFQSGNSYKAYVLASDSSGFSTAATNDGMTITLGAVTCPANFVKIPPKSGYTTATTCVAKYEAKQSGSTGISQASGTSWIGVTRAAAITACQANGTGYDLITNAEWQALAQDIESVSANFVTDASKGYMAIMGNVDSINSALAAGSDDTNPCTGYAAACTNADANYKRRIFKTSLNENIWDVSGNAGEWVKDDQAIGTGIFMNASVLTGSDKTTWGPAGNWSSYSTTPWAGLGNMKLYAGQTMLYRGGIYGGGMTGGIYTGYTDTSATVSGVGFRCVYHP